MRPTRQRRRGDRPGGHARASGNQRDAVERRGDLAEVRAVARHQRTRLPEASWAAQGGGVDFKRVLGELGLGAGLDPRDKQAAFRMRLAE